MPETTSGQEEFEDMTGKQWHERTLCPNDGTPLVRIRGGGMTCEKCGYHLDDTDV